MKKLGLIYVITVILTLVSCDRNKVVPPAEPVMFDVTFVDPDISHQSVQDAPAVDRLYIEVYESDSSSPATYSYNVRNGAVENKIDIPFKQGCSYELYLWAQKASGSVYSFKDGKIREGVSVKYPEKFKSDDLGAFDSYSAAVSFTYPDGIPSEIRMKRNVVKIDFAFFKDKLLENNISQVEMTVEGLTDIITFTDEVSEGNGKAVFRFEDLISGLGSLEDYDHDSRMVRMGSGYFPVDASYKVRIGMTMTDVSGNRVGNQVDDVLTVEKGMMTALIFNGDELVWKGLQDDILPVKPSKDGWIHISSVNEFASLLAGKGQKGAKYHICNDMDMSLLPSFVAEDLNNSAFFEDMCIDGGIYAGESVPSDYRINTLGSVKIHSLEIPASTGLFENVKDFEATNIVLEDITVGGRSEDQDGTGTFIGSSYGDLTLKNIKVYDSAVSAPRRIGGLIGAIYGGEVTLNDCDLSSVKVSTVYKDGVSGQAGGLIGYIGRSSEQDRSEEVDVMLFKCNLSSCTVTAHMQSEELHSGRLVGTLSGYDRDEKLNVVLSSADRATTLIHTGDDRDNTASKGSGRYVNRCKSAFCEDLPQEYEDLLGGQVYHRGLVRFGNYQVETHLKEFVPKWDGVTVVAPLKADPKYDGDVVADESAYVVYSPPDLVGLREITDSPSAIYLATSLDMNGQGEDGEYNVPENFADSYNESDDDNLFTSFSKVKLLEGNGNTIYNLGICRSNAKSSAFILSASGTTIHRNINFRNCCVSGTHTLVETNSTAQAAILCSNAGGKSYTARNVNVYDSKVFGVQKIGGLIAILSADDSSVTDCNVENTYIENYEVFIDELFTGTFEYKNYSVTASQSFYPHGEVGGLIGFVCGNAAIENSSVKNSEINCYGLDDVPADITPKQVANILAQLGYYHVPGRHVSTFIGDIRTQNGEYIQINNCRVDSKTKCTRRWDKYCWITLNKTHRTYPHIGSCYYVAYLDMMGSVYIDGSRINMHDCRKTSACYEHNIY